MTEHQQGTASKSPHVHKWIDKALLHEPPLKVCACGATMTDNEYRDSPNRDERDRAFDAATSTRPLFHDRHLTELQEAGKVVLGHSLIDGVPLADVLGALAALGIDPAEVRLYGTGADHICVAVKP